MEMVSGTSVLLLPVIVVLVVFGSILMAVALICWTIVRLVSSGGGRGKSASAEESRLIQELYQGLSKMERRVESLETLLLDRDKKGGQA